MEVIVRYTLNAFLGSLVTFYSSLLFIFLFKRWIYSPRALYYLYLIPFLKITWDLFSPHSNWTFFHGEKILNQLPGTRELSATAGFKWAPFAEIKTYLSNGYTFSIGDLLAETAPSISIALANLLLILATFSLLRFGWRLFKRTSFPQPNTPAVVGIIKPKIVLPKTLSLPPEEQEAIMAHEKAHIRWKDTLVNTLIEGISALFWFIPGKKRIIRKGRLYCEIACDQKGDPLHTAQALLKVSSANLPLGSIAFSSSRGATIKRATWLLQRKKRNGWIRLFSIVLFVEVATLIFTSHYLPF